jgi:hypothetical protein
MPVYWTALMVCGYCLEVVAIVLKSRGREMVGNKKRENIQEQSASNRYRLAIRQPMPVRTGKPLFEYKLAQD